MTTRARPESSFAAGNRWSRIEPTAKVQLTDRNANRIKSGI
jgi:hypothetical protein